MKRVCFFVLLIFFCFIAQSQELSQVKYSNGSILSSYSFTTDQKIVIRISIDGKVLEWGNLWDRGNYNYYPGKLQQYMGRVEYYGVETDSINIGKVKSIGTCFITYYGSFELPTSAGKVKSIGRTNLNYYTNFENEASIGKLRSAGSTGFTYYNSFDNDAIKGKPKSIGFNQITYYTTFDDKVLQGKIKSIGNSKYNWYGSTDRREYRGALKSPKAEQLIGGINFIVL